MKVSYIAPALGACALLAFSSCRSTNKDAYAEQALPVSELADGEIPPWLLDDDGSNGGQISAGTRTPVASNVRNQYSIPEPDAPASSSRAMRQNQPRVAVDNTHVEVQPDVDPLSGTPVNQEIVASHTPKQPRTGGSSGRSTSGTKPKSPTLIVYKVRPGDNLSVIASRSNTTVAQIMRDSNLKSTTIRPGQTIKVRYTPKGYKGGSKGSSAKGSGKTHTVTSGQTISGIAAKYGVSTSALMKANGLNQASARKIRPGQKLKIPSKR